MAVYLHGIEFWYQFAWNTVYIVLKAYSNSLSKVKPVAKLTGLTTGRKEAAIAGARLQ